jgi:hypothetical protein
MWFQSYFTLSDFKWVKKAVIGRKTHVKIFSAYNLLGYDDDKYYAPTGEKTMRIGLVAANKQFFYC